MITSRRPRSVLAVTAVLVAVGLALIPAGAALAHAGLLDSNPKNGSTVEVMPLEVRLTFNEDMNRPSFLTVTAPDGTVVADGEATIDGPVIFQPVTDPGLAGTYRVDYRGISADGHPVTGAVEFTVAAGQEVEAGPVEKVTSSNWWWIGLVAVPWVLLVGVLIWRRRSRA